MAEKLSKTEARKLALLSQQLPAQRATGTAKAATLSAIEHLGYIQVDTISVVQRAHHHTLWNRNPRYQPKQLDQLVEERQVFEYWSHAAAFLPMRDYRFSLPRKRALASGEREHWFDRDPQLEKLVIKRIRDEGPLLAKDFEAHGKRTGDWRTKPSKRALENLYMQGDLMSTRRINFQKVYDLTERVIPKDTDTTVPSPEEYARFLITQYLQAHGLGQASEIAYLQPGSIKKQVTKTLNEMVVTKEVIQILVGSETYCALPASLELLKKPLARSKLRILSPFDNLVIQRKRLQALFEFDYLIECYLPAAKRRYGYFTLPILWSGRLVARMDCKAERAECCLHIQHLALEPWLKKPEEFLRKLCQELAAFTAFNGCQRIRIHRTTPSSVMPAFQKEAEKALLIQE